MASFIKKQEELRSILSDTTLNDSKSSISNERSGHIFPVNKYREKDGSYSGFYFLAAIGKDGRCQLIGGMRDKEDKNCEETAIRETEEEIKINDFKLKKENKMIVNGSSVYVIDASGWSTTLINSYIKQETRKGYQYNEIKKVVWIRIDREISIKGDSEFKDFTPFVKLARRHFRWEIKNGRKFN
jgi:8-oxo-dGTP pyrophosphatase MutT (NUDIX family)